MEILDPIEFLKVPGLIVDVRSPGEHAQGHIPGALSLPLFDNEERSLIGTVYKQQGPEPAFNLGLELVGPKLFTLVKQVQQHRQNRLVKVHCWRGGMRSSSVANLLEMAQIPTVTLQGGYKNYRRHVLKVLESPQSLFILGGLTGVGKTAILQQLKELDEQILDLEALACHRGSTYGTKTHMNQPSNEQFENEIAHLWHSYDTSRPIWVEDESRMIGRCKIPDSLYRFLHTQPLIIIEKPLHERVKSLKEEYGQKSIEDLIQATQRLNRKLGGCRTKEIVHLIEQERLDEAIIEVLTYYDSTYLHTLTKRHQVQHSLHLNNLSYRECALHLINQVSIETCLSG
jgi:tRNA 2-selenouridine synthase